jgi:hypothetical protein
MNTQEVPKIMQQIFQAAMLNNWPRFYLLKPLILILFNSKKQIIKIFFRIKVFYFDFLLQFHLMIKRYNH